MDAQETHRRFHELAWPHMATVLRVATILTHDPTSAEDLAQETMLKAFRAIEQFKPGPDAAGDAKAWLLAILRNTRIDQLRKRQVAEVGLPEVVERVPDRPHSTWEDEPDWTEPQSLLEAFSDQEMIDALQMLPEEIRWTLLLGDVEGLAEREVAWLLEIPPGTVKSRLHRGRRMLRDALLPAARRMRLLPEVRHADQTERRHDRGT